MGDGIARRVPGRYQGRRGHQPARLVRLLPHGHPRRRRRAGAGAFLRPLGKPLGRGAGTVGRATPHPHSPRWCCAVVDLRPEAPRAGFPRLRRHLLWGHAAPAAAGLPGRRSLVCPAADEGDAGRARPHGRRTGRLKRLRGYLCVYVRVSVRKDDGKWYLLRDDIISLSFAGGPCKAGEERRVAFRFADHAFRLEPGDILRLDVAGASPHFAPHPNVAGDAFACATPKVARITIDPDRSFIELPCR